MNKLYLILGSIVAGLLLCIAGCGTENREVAELAFEPADNPCFDGVCQAAIAQLDFGFSLTKEEEGVSYGFDIDNKISDGEGSSCDDLHADAVSTDGRQGIDNQAGGLIRGLGNEVEIVASLAQDAINDGGVLYLVEIANYDGPGDNKVDLRVVRSGTVPLLGTDNFLLSGQSYAVHTGEDAYMGSFKNASIENGTVRAGPFDMLFPISILDAVETLHIKDTYIEFKLADDGSYTNGIVGGGLVIDDILYITRNYAVGNSVRQAVEFLIPNLADLGPDDNGDCQQLSIALRFKAKQGFLLE